MRFNASAVNANKPIILYMGTYPPRECGIATFTRDVTDAIHKNLSPQVDYGIVAMNANGSNIYNYPNKVVMELNDRELDDYVNAAKKINKMNNVLLVNIQHEYGIFGEDYGKYFIDFLHVLEKPAVITLHSILPKPNRKLKRVVKLMEENSSAFIVMAQEGIRILREDYGVEKDIFFIPHGIPFIPYEASTHEKKKLGYSNNFIISSFGMMNRGKGYEYVIESLPEVIEKYPNLLYLIVGETHPVVRKREGEEYRNFLEQKIKELGLEKNVKFYNKYVKLHEIIRYLKATDIYISAGLDKNQITSGTLVYAMGAGRPVISTPFTHAKEIINSDRGRLAEFKSPDSFKGALLELIPNYQLRKRLELNSYHYSRQMTWPNVAIAYESIFNNYVKLPEWNKTRIPEIKFSHLINLTDNFGVIQFARNFEPQLQHGYTTDDISRALVACCMHNNQKNDFSKINLIKVYLNYMRYVQNEEGRFYNYVGKDKKINTGRWTDDAHGRALWGLGNSLTASGIPENMKKDSQEMFDKGFSFASDITSPRGMAFTILGSYHYNEYVPDMEKIKVVKKLSNSLIKFYNEHKEHDWKWFEDVLTYDNSRMPEALLYSYLSTGDEKYLQIALESLDFLNSVSFKDGILMPIGQNGWYKKGEERALYDQQPIDAGSMVQALVTAYNITKNKKYKDLALKSFNWFLGKNVLNQTIYDDYTGGCYDGLGKECININQGAESTVSYLLARLSIDKLGKNNF